MMVPDFKQVNTDKIVYLNAAANTYLKHPYV